MTSLLLSTSTPTTTTATTTTTSTATSLHRFLSTLLHLALLVVIVFPEPTQATATPTDISLSSTSIDELLPVGTVVGNFTTTDVDLPNDTFTYSLTTGTGDTDNALFAINHNALISAVIFDFEAQSTRSIRVRSEAAAGNTLEKTFTITILDKPEPPSNIFLFGIDNSPTPHVAENSPVGTAVGFFPVIDPDFTFALVAGDGDDDNALFSISGTNLLAAAVFDYEARNSTYSIRVQVTDDAGLTFSKPFPVFVDDVNDAPTGLGLSSTSFDENANNPPSAVGTFVPTDQDANDSFTYQLVTGVGDDDNALFAINGDILLADFVANFEIKNSYSVRVQVTDSGSQSMQEQFIITVNDKNECPTTLVLSNLSVDENAPSGTVVGTITALGDPDASESYTYSMAVGFGDSGNSNFQIAGPNNNELQVLVPVDYETRPDQRVRIRVTDSGGCTYSASFTLTVNDANEPATSFDLAPTTFQENFNGAMGRFTTDDPDGASAGNFALVAGDGDDDNALFRINGDLLFPRNPLNFEADKRDYTVRVKYQDGDQILEQAFDLQLTNENETPTSIQITGTLTIAENEDPGALIGILVATDVDADESFVYTLAVGTGDANNADFRINGTRLETAKKLNFEAGAFRSVRIRATDAGGLFVEQFFVVEVTDENEPPTNIFLSSQSVDENEPAGTIVGIFLTTDPDAAFDLVSGEGDDDNAEFTVGLDENDFYVLLTNRPFSFEENQSFTIRVRVTDGGGLFLEQIKQIAIIDEEEPFGIRISNNIVAEALPAGAVVGTLTSSDTAESFTYAMVSGEGDDDNGDFVIGGNDGDVLQTTRPLDFEAKSILSIRVQTTDTRGFSFSQPLVLTVQDVNEAPIDITLSSISVFEQEPIGTVVGSLSSTDVDAGVNSFTYALVAGDGDSGNSDFAINGNDLVTAAVFNWDNQQSSNVRIQSTDSGGASFSKSFVVQINVVNRPPVIITDASVEVFSGTDLALIIRSIDPNDAVLTYSISGGVDRARFVIASSGELIFQQTPDVDNPVDSNGDNIYEVQVTVTDAGGLTDVQDVTVTVLFDPSTTLPPTPPDDSCDSTMLFL